MRQGTRKPVGPAASNDESAQLPIKPATSEQKYFAALIEGITNDSWLEPADFGTLVRRELW